jgi:hypothetical protein
MCEGCGKSFEHQNMVKIQGAAARGVEKALLCYVGLREDLC